MTTDKIPGASIILMRRCGRMLMVQRSYMASHPFKWCLPGGKCREGELAYECAKRELKEETGIDAEAFSTTGKRFPPPLLCCDIPTMRPFTFYMVKTEAFATPVELNGKNCGFGWFAYDELTRMDTMMPTILLEAIRVHNAPKVQGPARSGGQRNELLRYLRARRGG